MRAVLAIATLIFVWSSSVKADEIIAHPAGCPRYLFCGCGASVEVFGHPVRGLYLAWNWIRYPRASPGPGMVAVWRGHVSVIRQSYGDGTAMVYDANSGGGLTRIRRVSLRGAVIVDPHGGSWHHSAS